MTHSIRCALLLALLAACAPGPDTPTDLGPPPDFGPRVLGVSPDGMGYCCEPLRGGRSCGSPEFLPGGYVANPHDCLVSLHDVIWVPTTREFIDAHGCVALDPRTALGCNAPLDLGPADAELSDAEAADAASVDAGP
jgi:hypothetical protein